MNHFEPFPMLSAVFMGLSDGVLHCLRLPFRGGGDSSFLLINYSRFFKENWTNKKVEAGLAINKNHKNTLWWANPHSSGFDAAGLCRAYVSKLTSPPQPTVISAVPALCPPQGDKPRLRLKTAPPSFPPSSWSGSIWSPRQKTLRTSFPPSSLPSFFTMDRWDVCSPRGCFYGLSPEGILWRCNRRNVVMTAVLRTCSHKRMP